MRNRFWTKIDRIAINSSEKRLDSWGCSLVSLRPLILTSLILSVKSSTLSSSSLSFVLFQIKSEQYKKYSQRLFSYLINSILIFNKRLLQRCSLGYLKSNVIRAIIEQIIPNCHLEHRDASASMMAFLQTLVKLTSTNKKETKVNLKKEENFDNKKI